MNFIKNYWIGICSTLAIGIIGIFLYYFYVGYYNPSERIGWIIGKSIPYSFLVFVVAHFLKTRWQIKKNQYRIFCFAVSFFLCATYYTTKNNPKKIQSDNFRKELVRIIQNFETLGANEPMKEYSEKEYGESSKILPYIRHSLESFKILKTEYNEAMAVFESLSDPENLSDPEGLIDAKNQIAIVAVKLDNLKKGYLEAQKRNEAELNKIFPRSQQKESEFLSRFEKTENTSSKLMNEFFVYQSELIRKAAEILDFLSDDTRPFFEIDGELVFAKDDDLNLYNQLFEELFEKIQIVELMDKKLEHHKKESLLKLGSPEL